MPKPNNLKDIFECLSQEETKQPHYFIFPLGTDTVFTPQPTITLSNPVAKKSYERGETLSYAAQAVVSILDEEAEITKTTDPLSYCSPSVDVLNGPTTLGSEVGERVAQAVFLILRAIAEGKKTIQIAAHSRGAVESVLIMHELARIKKTLGEEPHQSLFDVLRGSPCSYTRAAVQKFFKNTEADHLDLRKLLLDRLQTVRINPFLIDPVPGGGFLKIPGIAWKDDRFYQQPPFDNYELLLYRDERTRCFTPIVPNGMQPLIIPGHHGSASGNRYNQQLEELPANIKNRDTTTVQDLVLCKIFHFFHKTTGLFAPNTYGLNLSHPELDGVLNRFLGATESERYKVILDHYLAVEQNDEAFRFFENGSYAVLGAQYTKERERFVHFHGNRHEKMRNVAPQMLGKFVNPEHAMLYLRQYIQLDRLTDATPDALVEAIANAIENTIDEMVLGDGKVPSKLLQLVRDKNTRSVFFEGLSVFVDEISQKYLRNNLTEEEDKRLRGAIAKPFALLARALGGKRGDISQDDVDILKECSNLLKAGLKRTIETHFKSIIEQSDTLHDQLEYTLAPPEQFQSTFKKFVSNLDTNADGTGILALLQAKMQTLRPITIEIVKQMLTEALEEIRSDRSLNLEQKAKINELILNEKNTHLDAFFEASQTPPAKHLANIEQLYNLVTSLKKDYLSLNELLSPEQLDIDAKQLHFRSLDLIKIAAMLLKEKKFDLHIQPDSISEKFFALIKKEAIALGASSPDVEDLEKALATREQRISQLTQETEKLREDIAKANEAHQHQSNTHGDETRSKNEEIQRITARASEQQELIKKLQSPVEVKKALLIDERLIPLVNNYLTHLLSEAIQLYPQLAKATIDQPLPEINDNDYKKIRDKFNEVHALKQELLDGETVPLASDRLERFKGSLSRMEDKLNLHRDSGFKRFLGGCLVIISIIVTGVLPGIGLLAYSTFADKKLSFFSTKTKGNLFVEEARKLEINSKA
ncbi:coiled-coil domain-containing protein [Legionella hackeliae]|uniref:Uncharacterized protein n=1 Tax=Legionella hackeliae TaxID=449 RepID=A0A0A8USM5_LEGHA|nr:hypothetical protein [Legionella hackeliae]KTD13810.1 hypothetical protein Lhac_0654 [Legionella hackeliae]CEK10511.1 protein of unknown function [Legionella hackeliae]STX47248.1 Uncharacterised protein [Legionella hackeliae]